MNITRELINQWLSEDHSPEGIAQRAVEWERERLSKTAGEPVAEVDFYVDDSGPTLTFTPRWYGHLDNGKHQLHTQDQQLAAIVRAEDAVTAKWAKYLLDNFGLEIE